MQRGREHHKILFAKKYHRQFHCVIGGLSAALGNPSWQRDQDFLQMLNQGKKIKSSKVKQLIEEQYGEEQVAIPFTSSCATSISFQTGLPRLLKTES
jgi:hypothetical protein